jgi:hypothetical protein
MKHGIVDDHLLMEVSLFLFPPPPFSFEIEAHIDIRRVTIRMKVDSIHNVVRR